MIHDNQNNYMLRHHLTETIKTFLFIKFYNTTDQ